MYKYKIIPLIIVFFLQTTIASGAIVDSRNTPIVKVVQENAAAVVNISTEQIVLLRENPSWGSYGSEFDVLFEQFFNLHRPSRVLELKSVGSGVIVDKSGVIVTNAHVVNMANNVFVILNDGTSIKGQVVYVDASSDLAVIKISPTKPLSEVTLGKTDDVIIGETAIVIGNPLGLENSVTAGIISGKSRNLHSSRNAIIFEDLIQTDAPINPGNSGGALLNLSGELIGINLAVVQHAQNIGFAIPVAKVKEIIVGYKQNQASVITLKKKKTSPRTTRLLKPQSQQSVYDKDRWDPLSEMARTRNRMDQILQDMFNEHDWHSGMGMFNSNLFYDPEFNMEETSNEYIIKLDVGDLDKNKIDIQVNKRSISISGERSEERIEENLHSFYSSKSCGSFSRIIPIPQNVDSQGIKTQIDEDILIIRLPKT